MFINKQINFEQNNIEINQSVQQAAEKCALYAADKSQIDVRSDVIHSIETIQGNNDLSLNEKIKYLYEIINPLAKDTLSAPKDLQFLASEAYVSLHGRFDDIIDLIETLQDHNITLSLFSVAYSDMYGNVNLRMGRGLKVVDRFCEHFFAELDKPQQKNLEQNTKSIIQLSRNVLFKLKLDQIAEEAENLFSALPHSKTSLDRLAQVISNITDKYLNETQNKMQRLNMQKALKTIEAKVLGVDYKLFDQLQEKLKREINNLYPENNNNNNNSYNYLKENKNILTHHKSNDILIKMLIDIRHKKDSQHITTQLNQSALIKSVIQRLD